MTQISALVLASMMSVEPPIMAEPASVERTVEAAHIQPMIDADALQLFVIETADRYSGDN